MRVIDSLLNLLGRLSRDPSVRRATRAVVKEGVRRARGSRGSSTGASSTRTDGTGAPNTAEHGAALSDRDPRLPLVMTYDATPDSHPDPGEIVWAWVSFEDDPGRGKDRPLLVLAEESGADGPVVVGLMLSSRDRGRGDHTDAHGNRWVDIGTGDWDRQGRASEVRINRLIRVRVADVRRPGGALDRARFESVANATRDAHGW